MCVYILYIYMYTYTLFYLQLKNISYIEHNPTLFYSACKQMNKSSLYKAVLYKAYEAVTWLI